ncbi:hypothetical protein [Mucilaginibacter lappiensis]|uniref:Uncharacterized protein n=1 Tax=Mucilaginibacter lappiensis TaxID=354630 RepID=A0A841JBI3_9SPHI|nr:hypothetical protein [Mucilaginibacter lappiensis]MBB6128483.1 hypothetical protein [Mucilaginibacter lappiensis]
MCNTLLNDNPSFTHLYINLSYHLHICIFAHLHIRKIYLPKVRTVAAFFKYAA